MYKKLLVKITCLSMPILFLVLSINIFIDSGFIFDDRSKKIAKILLSGKNCAMMSMPVNWGNLHQAILVEQIVTLGLDRPLDILVFGTSRSSEINERIFCENSFFNCEVPGGNIFDYVALYGLYKDYKKLPTYLIINIDPWTFHSRKQVPSGSKYQLVADTSSDLKINNSGFHEYLGKGAKLLSIENSFNYVDNGTKKYLYFLKEITSPSYFQINYRNIFKKDVYVTDSERLESEFVIRHDGSYTLPNRLDLDSMEVKLRTESFIRYERTLFVDSDISNIYFSYFKKLIVCLKKDGTIPILFISPVNPVVYDNYCLQKNTLVEEEIRRFCQEQQVVIVGSFNPHKYTYDFIGNNFVDAYHPVKSVVENIFKAHKSDLNQINLSICID